MYHPFEQMTLVTFVTALTDMFARSILIAGSDHYAPNLEEVVEAYRFGPVRACVRACVRVCVRFWATLFLRSRTIRDRIWKYDIWISMKNKRIPIFFFFFFFFLFFRRTFHCRVMPFFRRSFAITSLCRELCEQNISRTAWARVMIFAM